MKVLQLTAGLDIGRQHGGAERFGAELAAALAGQMEMTLFAFWRMGTSAESRWAARLRAAGVRVYFGADWQGRFYGPAYVRGMRAAAQCCRDAAPQVLHSHFQWGTLTAIGLKLRGLAPHIARTAHVTREWGLGASSAAARLLCTQMLFPWGCEVEVGVSRAVCARLDARPLARRRAVHIPNGIDLAGVRAAARQPFALADEPPRPWLAAVGRLTAQKDPACLLEAADILRGQGRRVGLIFAGDGELRDSLALQTQRLGLQGQVRFLGERADVPALLRSADLLVLPSRWEGLPTVILEGMAVGTPVIASAIAGTDELVQNGLTGWLTPPDDPQALAAKIAWVLDHPQEAHTVCHTAASRLEAYDLAKIAQDYIRIWRSLSVPGAGHPTAESGRFPS